MNETVADDHHDAFRATLEASEYTLTLGKSAEIVVKLSNPGPSGDFFEVNLLGIPPDWITPSRPPAIWIPAGGQEKVKFTVCPQTEGEDLVGSYLGRIHVFNQNAPDKFIQQGFVLSVVSGEKTKRITLKVDSYEFHAIPGAQIIIPLFIQNDSQEANYLELSTQGVPSSWVSLPSPVIYLFAGEEKTVELLLTLPPMTEVRAGNYPLKITAVSQQEPLVKGEVEVKLVLLAFESHGRVGVMLRSVQFSVAPGGSLTVPLTLLNRGLDSDDFRLGIEGIPVSWVSTSTPVIPLEPGENKELTLVIRPPLSPSSQAGRRKFRIVVTSQESPDQVVKVDCTMTVAAYTQFSAKLEPEEVEAGEPVSVIVQNEGNIQQDFHLSCESQNDQLIFEFLPADAPPIPQPNAPSATAGEQPRDPTNLPIQPGESAAFRFSLRPHQRPIIGSAVSYPYKISVGVKQKEPLSLPGQVVGRGMIPVWVLPIALFLFLCLLFSSSFLLFRDGNQTSSAAQTSAAGTALSASMTQTLWAGTSVAAGATQTGLAAGTAMSAGVTQTIVANQTAAAVAGEQDTDGDGLTNQREMEIQTNPSNPDTDGDGLMDGEEVLSYGTNPLAEDTDIDGLKDGDEVRLTTNPLYPDSDGDRLGDGDEIRLGTNPSNPDTDNDGLVDSSESLPCPNPLNPDTDQDGIIDGKDQSPCDPNKLAPTATVAVLQPTATSAIPTPIPPQQPGEISTPVPTSISLPRFNGLILFESDRDGNPEIYSADDSGRVYRLTNSPGADVQPAWGPGAERIAFTSNRDGQNEIYLMNADGSGLINLTNNPADDQYPAWSVDGEWIAFSSNREGNYEIYILRVSNFEIRNLTNSLGNDTQPNWVPSNTLDPSGEFIVFTSDRDGNLEIYRMKIDGTETVNLTAHPASDQMAKGSSDGIILIFTTDRDGNQEVYSMRIDGKGQDNLTNNPANDFRPIWSADQKWIAFTTDRDGNREVYIATKHGTFELYNLTNHPGYDQVGDWR